MHYNPKNFDSVKQLLKKYNFDPKKKYGQNFLLDEGVVQKMVQSITKINEVEVLEIGPGFGVLTKELLMKNVKNLYAVEIDKSFLTELEKLRNSYPALKIIHDDAIKFKEDVLFSGPFTVVANLPYNISSALIVKWMENIGQINEIIIMIQKELADRIVSEKDCKDYGKISVLTQYLCDCELLFDVPPCSFFPEPKVTSSVIKLTPKKKTPPADIVSKISEVAKHAFGQRRKKVKTSLNKLLSSTEEVLVNLEIDPNSRAENLSIDDFEKIAKMLIN